MASALTESMASFQNFAATPNFSAQQHPVDTGMCSDEEDWTSVADAAERRRIQNRNAQRKYRRNLKRRVQALEQQQHHQQQTAYRQTSPFPPTSIDLQHLFGPPSTHGFALPGVNSSGTATPNRATPLPTPPCEPSSGRMASQCATCHQCGSVVPMALQGGAAAAAAADLLALQAAGMTTPPFQHIVEDWTQTIFDDVLAGPDISMSDGSTTTTTPPNSVCGPAPSSSADSTSSSAGGNIVGGLNISLTGSDAASAASDPSPKHLISSPPSSSASTTSSTRPRTASSRQSISGRSLLHIAAERGNEAMVTFLLEQGGDPNAADDMGWTPLHLAVEQGHRETVSRLLEAGGNLFVKTA